jgi:hypothetical protein
MSQDVTPSQGSGQHPDSHAETSSFLGGITIAVVALILLLLTFTVTSPTVPRIMSIALGVVGVATAFGLVPVRAPQDYYGGLVLVMLATLALVASAELPGQRGFAFGPGTAPRLFAAMLAGFGLAVAIVGVAFKGPRIEKYRLRGPLWVLLAIVVFAMIIRPYGLVIAAFVTFLISIYGSTEMRWIESIIAAAAMTAFCVLLFVYLLNLPFQLKPYDWTVAHVTLWNQFAEFFKLIFGPLLKAVGVM